MLAEYQSAAFSFLALDCPVKTSDVNSFCRRPLAPSQRDAFEFLVSANLRFGRLRPSDGPSRGLASLSTMIQDFESKWVSLKEKPGVHLDTGPSCGALVVNPERVRIPIRAGKFDPASVLPEPLRTQFLGLEQRF